MVKNLPAKAGDAEDMVLIPGSQGGALGKAWKAFPRSNDIYVTSIQLFSQFFGQEFEYLCSSAGTAKGHITNLLDTMTFP